MHICHPAQSLDQGLATCPPWAKSCPLPVAVSRVSLEHSHILCLHTCTCLLPSYCGTAEWLWQTPYDSQSLKKPSPLQKVCQLVLVVLSGKVTSCPISLADTHCSLVLGFRPRLSLKPFWFSMPGGWASHHHESALLGPSQSRAFSVIILLLLFVFRAVWLMELWALGGWNHVFFIFVAGLGPGILPES